MHEKKLPSKPFGRKTHIELSTTNGLHLDLVTFSCNEVLPMYTGEIEGAY